MTMLNKKLNKLKYKRMILCNNFYNKHNRVVKNVLN